MPGFIALIAKSKQLRENCANAFDFRHAFEKDMICRSAVGANYQIQQLTNKKFLADKVFEQNEHYLIGIDGVILNFEELNILSDSTENSYFRKIIALYEQYGADFVNLLRGDFSGFIYDKQADNWLIFTNQTGSKRIFIFQNEEYLIFSSDLYRISLLMKELNIPRSLLKNAAYALLTSGFMLNEITFVEGVTRLLPGNYIKYSNGKSVASNYFNLKNTIHTRDNKNQIVEQVDALFRQAIKRQFEKDIAYNYKHIATLSGGLDSRMVVLMAHKMGYTDQLNFTFSQANYLDEQIAKQIAVDYKHEFLFQSLDHGNYLKNIDEIVAYNDGLILFSGSAHVLKSCKNMNFDAYGLVHTGLIGDAVLGSFLSKPFAQKPEISASMYSNKLLTKVAAYNASVQENYETEELYKFYGRAFMGATNGNYILDVYSQSVSPFLDIDFLTYCYSIPENLKFKQKIYIDWIAEKNKEFAVYPWEKTGVSPLVSLNKGKYFAPGYYKRMSMKLFDKLSGKMKSGMNPFDYWLENNAGLRAEFDFYFAKNIDRVDDAELRDDCIWLYKNGNWGERFQVLTLLSAIKLHFS